MISQVRKELFNYWLNICCFVPDVMHFYFILLCALVSNFPVILSYFGFYVVFSLHRQDFSAFVHFVGQKN